MTTARRFTWDKEHAKGLALGILTTALVFPLAAYLQEQYSGNTNIWYRLGFVHELQARVLGWAAIPNLFWFHFFLKKKKWSFGKGIIYATVLNLLVVIFLKFVF